jgi:drug/metabolite transporter (DMT)-like permease
MTRRGWLLFAAVSLLWGIPYALIKVAVDDGVPPASVAFGRVVIGALVLLTLAWRAGTLRTLRGRVRWLAVFAVVEIAVPFPLLAVGERHISSSLAAIVIATAPLFVALLALRYDPGERMSRGRIAGLLIGLLGVVALLGIDVAGSSDLLFGTAVVLVVAFGYAVGPMILKRHLGDLDPRASMGASLAIAALLMSPAVALERPSLPSAHAAGAIVALGLLCTAAALSFYGALVAEVGAGRALVITYLNPVVAVAVGVGVLGESVGVGAAVGLVLILCGAWFGTGGGSILRAWRARPRSESASPASQAGPAVRSPMP